MTSKVEGYGIILLEKSVMTALIRYCVSMEDQTKMNLQKVLLYVTIHALLNTAHAADHSLLADIRESSSWQIFKNQIGANYIAKKFSGSETFTDADNGFVMTITTPAFDVTYNIAMTDEKNPSFRLIDKPKVSHYALARHSLCLSK